MLKNVIMLMGLFFLGCGDGEESNEIKYPAQ